MRFNNLTDEQLNKLVQQFESAIALANNTGTVHFALDALNEVQGEINRRQELRLKQEVPSWWQGLLR
jgi:hypothetical protein